MGKGPVFGAVNPSVKAAGINGAMFDTAPQDRRRFLRLAMTLSTGALLAGCGGGGAAGDAVVVVPGPDPVAGAPPVATPTPVATATPLGLALNLAYLGAQYYGIAARGVGLPASLTSGAGIAGVASGGRQATFADPLIAGFAVELADDKQAQVAALRGQIGAGVAAQPAIDVSTGARGAFSVAAQGAGIVAPGAAFDPYASDDNFLIGALLLENAVAAAHRTLLGPTTDTAIATLVTAQLGDAIYHGGLVRALLDGRIGANPTLDKAVTNTTALLASLDGSNIGDQTLAGSSGASSNLFDADGRAIPFTRADAQILKALYLSNGVAGGFLPAGANGVMT